MTVQMYKKTNITYLSKQLGYGIVVVMVITVVWLVNSDAAVLRKNGV